MVPLTPTERLWTCLRTRHLLWYSPCTTTKSSVQVTSVTNLHLLLFAGAVLFFSFTLSESSLYLFSYDYCVQRKDAVKCSSFAYRAGKFLQKLGPLLHLFLAALFLPLSKNSIFHALLGSSFERAVSWHRFVGRWLLILVGSIHGTGFMLKWLLEGRLLDKVYRSDHNWWGFVAFVTSLCIVLLSRDSVRRHHYFLFRTTHMAAAPVYILGVSWHHGGRDLWMYLSVPMVLYVLDVLYRLVRGWRQSRKATVVALRRFGSNCCALTLSTGGVPIAVKPGQWMYVMLPALSKLDPPKPFTVLASQTHLSFLEILIKSNTTTTNSKRWTPRLVNMAGDKGDNTGSASLLVGTSCLLDGPYGSFSLPLPLHKYTTVLLVGGGIGITPWLALLDDHAANWIGDSSSGGTAGHALNAWRLLWCVKESSGLFAECENRLQSYHAQCTVHVTGSSESSSPTRSSGRGARSSKSRSNSMNSNGSTEGVEGSPRRRDVVDSAGVLMVNGRGTGNVRVHQGRPDVALAVQAAAARDGWTAVVVCGPPGLVKDVRTAVRKLQTETSVYFNGKKSSSYVHYHEETFEL